MKIAEILKYAGYYFKHKDKKLWSGAWVNGSIVVPDAKNYRLFKVMVGQVPCIGYRANGGLFYAYGIAQDGSLCNTYALAATLEEVKNGYRLTKDTSNFMTHLPSAGHKALSTGNGAETVSEIVGIEPDMSKILGGGGTKFSSILFRRWLAC